MSKHERWELAQMQSLPLDAKIGMTEYRIREWVEYYGEDGVSVSFSGGKDSTVLLHILRKIYPNVKAIFFDTGLEYPEIRLFVKGYENVDWIRPKMNFREVITKHGYPFISKEVSECVQGARKYLTSILNEAQSPDRQHKYSYFYDKLTSQGKYSQKGVIPSNSEIIEKEYNIAKKNGERHLYYHETEKILGDISEGKYLSLAKEIASKDKHALNCRTAMLLGEYEINWGKNKLNNTTGDKSNRYSQEKYKFFLDAPFEISNKCCNIMKKNPSHTYMRETGRKPITAQMASESQLRTQKWLQNGCNAFESKNPISNPMSFWTEQDVLLYIKKYIEEPMRKSWENANYSHGSKRRKARKYLRKINYRKKAIASVYGDIVTDFAKQGQVENQMNLSDFGIYCQKPVLKTTGCNRTGCMFCGFGLQLEKSPNRFERMAETHPKQLDYVMRGGAFDDDGLWKPDNRGLGYWFVIEWINIHGGLKIEIPNREYYLTEYQTEETKKYLERKG